MQLLAPFPSPNLSKMNSAKVCYDKTCVEATGKNADILIGVVALSLLAIAVTTVIKIAS
jgi:hypothetical protein